MVSWAPRLPPAVSGSGARCGRVCWARVSPVPSPSWLGCRGVFFFFFLRFGFFFSFFFFFFRALWSLSLHPLSFGLGWWLSFFFFFSPCPFSPSSAVTGLVLPILGGWLPCASAGVPPPPFFFFFFFFSWGGGLAACGGVGGWLGGCGLFSCLFPFPPPFFFFFWGGLPVPPSAFPGLAHALACIQCCLPGCCLQLRSVWPCSGPMGRVGFVHGGLGAPSCWVRSWLCRLGGCARRLLVVLGQGAGVARVLTPLRCRLYSSGWSVTVVAWRAVAPCVACGAGVWRGGAAPSRVCGGWLRLVPQVRVSCVVLCRSVPRRVASCCGALLCGALWCGVPWSRVVPRWVSGGQPGLCGSVRSSGISAV